MNGLIFFILHGFVGTRNKKLLENCILFIKNHFYVSPLLTRCWVITRNMPLKEKCGVQAPHKIEKALHILLFIVMLTTMYLQYRHPRISSNYISQRNIVGCHISSTSTSYMPTGINLEACLWRRNPRGINQTHWTRNTRLPPATSLTLW